VAYSAEEDLLLGDLRVSEKIDKGKYVDDAAEEIDSKIGELYVLPLSAVAPATDLAPHSRILLKRINNQLATGRLILALHGGDEHLHAYGLSLVNGALGELAMIANGVTSLVGAARVAGSGEGAGPSIVNQDAYSATAAFEAFVMGGVDTIWRPGV
jgi:hypothetical protein